VRYRNLTDYEGANPRHAPVGEIHCKVLVIAAGALGSTYLMLDNARRLGGLPAALGTKFCGNGDLLGFIRGRNGRVIDGSNGPVISSTMRVGDALDGVPGATGRGLYLQDGGYPAFAQWLVETSVINHPIRRSSRAVQAIAGFLSARLRGQPSSRLATMVSSLIGGSTSAGTLPVLGMGRDIADGIASLRGGWLDIAWDMESSRTYFDRVKHLMEEVARELDGDLTINPTWLLKRVVTVHPLGGCPMGTAASAGEVGAPGVVDDHGEVFGHPGLFVADGSVMPGPVGPNPSLTIAALGERFSRRMIERCADG